LRFAHFFHHAVEAETAGLLSRREFAEALQPLRDVGARGKPDQDRINVHEAWERKRWANELGISEDELRDAVRFHGPMVKDVKKALGR
jgi:hypothetical protein